MNKGNFSPRIKAILQAVMVTVLWSSSWVLIKISLRDDLPALHFAGMRYVLAFLILGLFVVTNPLQRQEITKLTSRDWGKLALLGIVFYSLTQGAMFMTLKYLPANMLSLLLNLTAVFVGISGIFLLKESPTLIQWAGISLATIGVMAGCAKQHVVQHSRHIPHVRVSAGGKPHQVTGTVVDSETGGPLDGQAVRVSSDGPTRLGSGPDLPRLRVAKGKGESRQRNGNQGHHRREAQVHIDLP